MTDAENVTPGAGGDAGAPGGVPETGRPSDAGQRGPQGQAPHASGTTDSAGRGRHEYADGGAGASSEPGGEDEFDHTAGGSGSPTGSAGSDAPVDSAEAAIADEDALASSYLADLQRLQAEYVNYKKRVDRDREVIRTTAVGSVVEALLPVLDDIHMARQAGDLAEGPFASISDKLESILGRYGVERLGEAGQEFDPNVHEALMHVEAELPEGSTGTTVVQVLQPGYRIGERLVRAARVSVADPV
ncbi:nucleotide exchange factor GrpE [Terracoccus luteus]|uniref:Protein GrpE n=1 Tax=Terracoccus luteus TaxID=53356 RepID=A0A839PUZ2_9MICO|nr:nucleotide exchange factor GrpE [Terracoccus luteus]MBB2988068.1 molecular chaperone GrpE [Terracoccus luteus]MCP2173719.1 molecular chaperone GrpE [Terracoccus luteus]